MRDLDAVFRAHRQRAFDVAYRMLGSVAAAEDVVQEAFARLARTGVDGVDDVRGWLVTVCARLSLDHLRAASHRRTSYVGPWLPEPLVEGRGPDDPLERVTLDESVQMAVLVVLQQLSPPERTAFLLHDVFQVPFEEVAAVVGRTPEACRQLASRARRRLRDDAAATRFPVDRAHQRAVTERFAAACRTGRLDALLEALDPEAVGEFDSGGFVPGAPRHPVRGARRIARLLQAAFAVEGIGFLVAQVNGEAGVIVERQGRVAAVVVVTPAGGRVGVLHAVGNPEKLAHLNRS